MENFTEIKKYIKKYCDNYEEKQDLLELTSEFVYTSDSFSYNDYLKFFMIEENNTRISESNYTFCTKRTVISFYFHKSKCHVSACDYDNLLEIMETMIIDLQESFILMSLNIIIDYILYPIIKNKHNYYILKNILILHQVPHDIKYEKCP